MNSLIEEPRLKPRRFEGLVDNRPVAYEALFKGELPYEPQPDEADIGIAGLWRALTEKRGGQALH